MELNAREQLKAAAEWLDCQSEDMSFGLRSAEDGLKLWKHMRANHDLSDFADEWEDTDRVKAIGYCPFIEETHDT